MCPGARRWHAGPADGAVVANTAMCESEYDAATRDDPFGANAGRDPAARTASRCATAFPQRSHPAVPRARARVGVRHHGHFQGLRSRRTSQSFTRPSAAPAERSPSCANARRRTRKAAFRRFVFVFVFVFPLISRASSRARARRRRRRRAAGSPASPRARERRARPTRASAPSLPHDANTSPPLPGRTATALTVPGGKRNAPSSAAVSASKSRASSPPDAVTRRGAAAPPRVEHGVVVRAEPAFDFERGKRGRVPETRGTLRRRADVDDGHRAVLAGDGERGEFGVAEPPRRQKRTTNGASGRSSAASAPYPSDTETAPPAPARVARPLRRAPGAGENSRARRRSKTRLRRGRGHEARARRTRNRAHPGEAWCCSPCGRARGRAGTRAATRGGAEDRARRVAPRRAPKSSPRARDDGRESSARPICKTSGGTPPTPSLRTPEGSARETVEMALATGSARARTLHPRARRSARPATTGERAYSLLGTRLKLGAGELDARIRNFRLHGFRARTKSARGGPNVM